MRTRDGADTGGPQNAADAASPEEKDMRKRVILAACGGLAAVTIGVFGAAASASASTASPVVGYTYVNGNTAGANTVAGFDRHADGSLTPIPGSPFAAGGAGLGAGLASQGAIQVTGDGRYLLAVDAGSNQISVLRITAGGVPVLAGQPVASGGADMPAEVSHAEVIRYRDCRRGQGAGVRRLVRTSGAETVTAPASNLNAAVQHGADHSAASAVQITNSQTVPVSPYL